MLRDGVLRALCGAPLQASKWQMGSGGQLGACLLSQVLDEGKGEAFKLVSVLQGKKAKAQELETLQRFQAH